MDTELSDGPPAADPGVDPAPGGDRWEPPGEHDAPGSSDAAIDRVDRLLDEVELALTRLDDGTYGRCRSCGSSIADVVLVDDPTAQQCGQCGTATASGPVGGQSVADAAGAPDLAGRDPLPGPAS